MITELWLHAVVTGISAGITAVAGGAALIWIASYFERRRLRR
ncbi:MAG: hypothetical protein Q8J64_06420 [Thermodesulfovibrionales bacterium]|nr:hypothetical protein [Thermodesulfovibrionales bacterium]